MKTIQEMLQELSQCIVTVSGEFRFRTNWNGGKVPQPDLDTFDPNVPFCIENVGETPVEIGLYNDSTDVRDQCVYSYDLKTWQNYKILTTESISTPIVLSNNGDRVYIKASFHDVAPKFGATHFYLLNESANTKIRARGNIASLNDVDENEYKLNYLTAPKYCYYEMFKDCTSLVQGPDLPATNLETKSYFRMFYGCTSLIQAPNLPAEVLTESCYDEMFHKCAGLVTPPTISAKTLANQCCRNMFADCTSLTQAPALPATTLAEYCYDDMFARCASLTQAPELPATILAPACYYGMFAYCTSLTQAPELPATTLANICCLQMFCHCTSLTQAPELPATTLADGCYKQMFEGCTNLSQAPELPAKWLREYCYQFMFDGCTKLNYVKCLATDGFTSTGCTTNWLRDVAPSGTFECDNKKYFTLDSPNGIPTGWNITEINPAQPEPEKPDLDIFDPNVPFCIENVGETQASVQYNTKNTNIKISKDYKTWNDYTTGDSITLDPTERVYIKSDYVRDTGNSPRFVFNGDGAHLRARGNIASLIYGTNDAYVNKYTSTEEYCYTSMFNGCTSLVQTPELPATTLATRCYYLMFRRCTSLTQAPELPATTLATRCYDSMFQSCTSFVQAPELPATTLATQCYDSMFQDCTSLTQAPELPATTLAYGCYRYMFYGCTSLTQAPELPATTLNDNCYQGMFYDCTSLTQAPELSAATLADYCYYNMFSGCTKLNYVKCLATNTAASYCLNVWLYGVASTGTFECDNKKYFTVDSPNGIPVGWSITEINPDPPAPEKPDLDTFDPNVPFCIENVGDVPANIQYNTKNTNIKISKDYNTWDDYTKGDSITLDPTERVYIKSDYVKDTEYHPRFVFNGNGARLRARGNIASLLYGTDDVYVNKYTSTEEHCYKYMFQNCTSLTQAPDLPATTLANYCYHQMFYGCTSLTQAPELPATILHDLCYFQMFYGCASLTQVPDLPAITLAQNCYSSMFEGCTSLTQAPGLPATVPAYMCYANMFKDCTSLTRAPELPITRLYDLCYASMFKGCTKLNYVKCLATNISAKKCTASWLEGVATTGDFYTPAATNWTTGNDGIPIGWTRHDIT